MLQPKLVDRLLLIALIALFFLFVWGISFPPLMENLKEIKNKIEFLSKEVKDVKENIRHLPTFYLFKPKSCFLFSNCELLLNLSLGKRTIPLEKYFGFLRGEAVYLNKLGNSQGVLMLHPIDRLVPRVIETKYFELPKKGFILIRLGNAAWLTEPGTCTQSYYDNVFKIYLITEGGEEINLFDGVVKCKDGWKLIGIPTENLKLLLGGEKVKIRIESWAGGDDNWNGERGVIDYIDVVG